MQILQLQLKNFRNYESLALSFAPGLNIFIGENAQGKTNILEAVYYTALARSHRTNVERDLIKLDRDAALVKVGFTRRDVERELEFRLHRAKRRQITSAGKNIRLTEIVGLTNMVFFSPEDLYLVKGAPAKRRRFLDAELSQASPAYFHALLEYVKIVDQRARLLKDIRDGKTGEDTLDSWDEALATRAAEIVRRRMAAVAELGDVAAQAAGIISQGREQLKLVYEVHHGEDLSLAGDLGLWYHDKLAERRRLDILRGATGVGPHRDDLVLILDDKDLRSYGSQGQQRTGALALKLAELEFLRRAAGEYPVLLLDDVMSELDKSRREKLLAFVREKDIQTFITATDDEGLAKLAGTAAVYRVERGRVQPLE